MNCRERLAGVVRSRNLRCAENIPINVRLVDGISVPGRWARTAALTNGLAAHSTWCAAHKPRDQNGSARLRLFSGTHVRANEGRATAHTSAKWRENATFRMREKCEKRLKTRRSCKSRRVSFMRVSRIDPNRGATCWRPPPNGCWLCPMLADSWPNSANYGFHLAR
jgi:hypothetical protein